MKSKKSFTLIELLVVIAIIGILSSLVILNITTGKDKANNAKRVQEANGLVKALSIYENQYGFSGLTGIDTTLKEVCNTNLTSPTCVDMVNLSDMQTKGILSTIPVDPSAEGEGTGYWIAYNEGANEPMVVPGNYQATCPDGYVSVPGNSYYNTLPGFCVMKWEAKNSGGAVSQASGLPWVGISQTSAKDACSNANGAHLITNNEWMTINRNIEAQGRNWTGVTGVGDGMVYRGNHEGTGDASCYAEEILTGENTPDPLCFHDGRNKRILYLTNNEEIWDMSGNVWQWVDQTVTGSSNHPSPSGSLSGITNYGQFSYDDIRPSQPSWSHSQGLGYYYSSFSESERAFCRGGSWGNGSSAGLFALLLGISPTNTGTLFGFRCAR
jgi:prepilin-type N-terminal cleavage/methylation domain-containing protein